MKYWIRLLGALILSLVGISCNEQVSRLEDSKREPELRSDLTKPERFQNPFDGVGQIHNSGLNRALSFLKANRKQVHSKEDLINLGKKAVEDFLIENKDISGDIVLSLLEIIHRGSNRGPFGSPQSFFSSDSLFLSIGYKKSQITFLNRLFSLSNGSLSIENAKDSISNINASAVQILGADDSRPILLTSSVLESSLDYWSVYLKEWKGFVASLNPTRLLKRNLAWEPDWQGLAAADAAGAAAAALPCILATIGYWACVAEAAVFASVVEATIQLWNYLFP